MKLLWVTFLISFKQKITLTESHRNTTPTAYHEGLANLALACFPMALKLRIVFIFLTVGQVGGGEGRAANPAVT